jgi:hypothetical protein
MTTWLLFSVVRCVPHRTSPQWIEQGTDSGRELRLGTTLETHFTEIDMLVLSGGSPEIGRCEDTIEIPNCGESHCSRP